MTDLLRSADVLVIGGGVHGASVAYNLVTKRPGIVLLLEARTLASGPSGSSSGVVHRFFGSDFLTRSGDRSADIFREWAERIGGDPGYREVGHLILSRHEDADSLRLNVVRAQARGVQVALLGSPEVQELVPEMVTHDVACASFQARAGYADGWLTTHAFASRAKDLGAWISRDTTATEIVVERGRVSGVRTPKGDVLAPTVVLCAGPWSPRLLLPLGVNVPLTVERHQMCLVTRPSSFRRHPAIVDGPNDSYGRPDVGDVSIFGDLTRHETVDPDDFKTTADADQLEHVADIVVRRFPVMAQGGSRGGYAHVYDVTPDHQPVLGAIREIDGLYVDFGWSGHGLKHAPAIGEVMAAAILDGGHPAFDISPYSWSRFGEGALLPSHRPTASRVLATHDQGGDAVDV